MLNSIANLKESLNKIALDVHGSDEDLRTHGGGDEDSAVFDRRNSHSFAQSKSVSRSPVGNAVESPCRSEIEQYKAEIKRLQKSEAEIKSLSVNYASLLKEREDRISRLNEENGSLKQNLNATKHRSDVLKGNGDHSNNRQHKLLKQVKNRSNGNQIQNGFVFKQDGLSNGTHAVHPDAVGGKTEKGLADLLEEKNKSLAAVRIELEKERNTSANLQHKLQDELNLNSSYEEELKSLRGDKENACAEMRIINTQLNERTSNIRRLQMELHRRNDEDAGDVVQSLKRVIAALEKENGDLKLEKDKVEAALKNSRSFPIDKVSSDVSENSTEHPSTLNEKTQSFGGSLEKELELTVQKLEKDLKGAREERDKAIQELARLKQHLLDKESEESDKMDEDSKIIEELRANNEYKRAQVLQLEKALKQAISSQEEVKMTNNQEFKVLKDTIDDLNKKVTSCLSTIDAKNVELLNLQTALGQYYAEIEAKENLERDFSLAREEIAKLSELLKDTDQRLDMSNREKEEITAKLLLSERLLAEGKTKSNKLEEDNLKLRRALEQSMTRINRMSMDSDYFVDRRIVIKLLVTYFQRNHSKEVLDLMVRMLGFSDEDKQRIGGARQGAGKGVVRGVLGLPSRLVGGMLGGGSTEAHGSTTSEDQSFGDLWVDFLLKETEEREKREAMAANGELNEDRHKRSPLVAGAPVSSSSPIQNSYSPLSSHGNSSQSVNSESEFSTVPLSSSESNSQVSRLFTKY